MHSVSPDQFAKWSRLLRRSDQRAYTELFQAMYEPLYRYAWYFTKDSDLSYDILQDVFLKLWQVRERVDPQKSLKALLYQMTRNTALNHDRYKKRHATSPLDDAGIEPSNQVEFDVSMDAEVLKLSIEDWIAELPQRRREAFVLSRYQGFSHSEIASIMNLTPKTVNNHIVLALQHLRNRMQAYNQDRVTS